MLSSRALATLSEASYVLLLLTTICAVGLSCVALLSQAVRTSPARSWGRNYDALIIGAAYAVVFVTSLMLCVKRRVAVRQKLQKIGRPSDAFKREEDVPEPVRRYILQEYARTCLVSYASLPTGTFHEGIGRPGSKYADVRFRSALLNTITQIDDLAHAIIPSHPILKPHARMLHHFRFVLPLLPTDEDGLTPLHYYDAAIQLARVSSREPTERELEIGMAAAREITKSLDECRLEMLEDASSPEVNAGPSLRTDA